MTETNTGWLANLLANIVRRPANSPGVRLYHRKLSEFVRLVDKIAYEGGTISASTNECMSILISKVISLAEREVFIFGDILPAKIFLTPLTREAMHAFLQRNRDGIVTVATTDPNMTVGALCNHVKFQLDAKRIRILRMTPEDRAKHGFRFVYADSTPNHSFWWNNFDERTERAYVPGSKASFQDELTGTIVRAYTEYVIETHHSS